MPTSSCSAQIPGCTTEAQQRAEYGLGITTLLTHVETPIAVTHQVTALLIVGVLLTLLHRVLRSDSRPHTARISTGTI